MAVFYQQAGRGCLDSHLSACLNCSLGQGAVKYTPFQDIPAPPGGPHRTLCAIHNIRDLSLTDLCRNPLWVRLDKECQLIVPDPFGAAHGRADLLALFQQQDGQPGLGSHLGRCRTAGSRPNHHEVVLTLHSAWLRRMFGILRLQGTHRAGKHAIATVNTICIDHQLRLGKRERIHRTNAHAPPTVGTAV
jgi:hypothetical protein